MQVDRQLSPVLVAAFNTVMAARTIHCVYQPIVALDSGSIVGYEALARGPAGTTWSKPDAMVSYAARVGRLPELDWICRAAACRGALAATFPRHLPLFINVEPASSRTECPPDLLGVIEDATQQLQIVAEVTERSVAKDPAGLLAAIEQLRASTNRIALDDIGVESASQAMMSLVRPDVIKLDRSIVDDHAAPAAMAVIDAVRAEAARTGALILAEGIETAEHLAAAKSMGASLGQGWLFGRPGPLPRHFEPSSTVLPQLAAPPRTATTPFEVAQLRQSSNFATKKILLPLSRELEDRGVHASEPTVLLTTFQHGRYFDRATRLRYTELAEHGVLTATFAHDMPLVPGPNIRGCPLAPDDPLVDEWNVIVIGSQFVGGLFAKQRPLEAHAERAFDLILSQDRELVLAAARPLIERLPPG
jgi:EAL domain-containing protein (putative c-di-GMP-specific phosphodiesterase class I)/DICT domain-containing protein